MGLKYDAISTAVIVTNIVTKYMHRPFLLNWPLTLIFKTIETIRNNHFRNLLIKMNISIYNKPWFTMKASLKCMSYYFSK